VRGVVGDILVQQEDTAGKKYTLQGEATFSIVFYFHCSVLFVGRGGFLVLLLNLDGGVTLDPSTGLRLVTSSCGGGFFFFFF
jgi:hypothetical protein